MNDITERYRRRARKRMVILGIGMLMSVAFATIMSSLLSSPANATWPQPCPSSSSASTGPAVAGGDYEKKKCKSASASPSTSMTPSVTPTTPVPTTPPVTTVPTTPIATPTFVPGNSTPSLPLTGPPVGAILLVGALGIVLGGIIIVTVKKLYKDDDVQFVSES